MPSWILAIDFGTSYTVAAAKVADRAPEIVEIAGERRMPSVVMVDPGGDVFVGRTAEDLSVTHPGSTLRALKNRLGDQTPAILGGRPHQVVTLVAALLHEVYDQVVVQFGEPPGAVHLTHPATWNQPRVNRLVEAAAKAGLPRPLLVPEPVAAALSYAADVGLDPGRPIVVYDLGGGTFDSAVVTARDGGFEVVGRPGGDQHIGGELFDELIVNYVGEMLEPQVWEAIQVGDDPLWRQVGAALRNESRRAKEALSSHPYVNLLVPLPAGLWQVHFTRDEFHEMVRPYIAETITTLRRCVEEAGVQPGELAGISLVGGSSRSPIVEEMVREAFPMAPISRRGDPKATVAAGATLAERPSSSSPRLWRSPVTQEASPGTAQQRVRIAPPPISAPPDAPRLPSDRPSPAAAPAASRGASPAASPAGSPPPPGPAAESLPHPAPMTPGARPPSPPPSRPPAAPSPPPRLAPPPTVALPIQSGLRPEPALGASGARSRRLPVLLASLVVVGAVVAGVIVATRSDGDTSGSAATPVTTSASGGAGSVVPGSADESSPAVSAPLTDPLDTGSPSTGDPSTGTDPSATDPSATDPTDTDPTGVSVPDVPIGTRIETLSGHKDEVLSAAFSPDGGRLVTASLDHLAIVWDVATGAETAVLAGHLDEVYSAEFSPDGTLVATTGADRTVRLWDADSGAQLYTFTGHTDVVYQVRFSPDGNQLLSASADRTARLWDIPSGTEAALFAGSTESVYFAEFSPDGSLVVAGGQDDVVRVWSLFAPDQPRLFEGHTADVQIGSFSPDQTLMVTGADDGTTKVWDARDGRLVYDFVQGGGVWAASFSHDGTKVLTSGADRTATIWDVASGRFLGALIGHTDIVFASVFSPDDTLAVTASADGTAKLWDVGTEKEIGAVIADLVHPAPLAGAVFSPDGALVVTVGADGSATIWAA